MSISWTFRVADAMPIKNKKLDPVNQHSVIDTIICQVLIDSVVLSALHTQLLPTFELPWLNNMKITLLINARWLHFIMAYLYDLNLSPHWYRGYFWSEISYGSGKDCRKADWHKNEALYWVI